MIVESLLANFVILLGLALILWVVAVQIGDVSFVDAFWGGGMALLALVSWLRLYEPGALATLLMAMPGSSVSYVKEIADGATIWFPATSTSAYRVDSKPGAGATVPIWLSRT